MNDIQERLSWISDKEYKEHKKINVRNILTVGNIPM